MTAVWTCHVSKAADGLVVRVTDTHGWAMTFRPQPTQENGRTVYIATDVEHDIPAALAMPLVDNPAEPPTRRAREPAKPWVEVEPSE